MKHTISALVSNRAGVLYRIAGLFARRGFNIDSLAVGPTDHPEVSRVTILTGGDDYTSDQVVRQLDKLIDVKKVKLLPQEDIIVRETVLVKVGAEVDQRSEIIDIAKILGCEIVDISHTSLMLELSERPCNVDLLLDLLSKYQIIEIARTGAIALEKGENSI
jgi:acetolactate synthase-1/3 small subunit